MKRRILSEDQQMMDVNRSVSGVGPGSKDDPLQKIKVPTSDADFVSVNTTLLPHELNFVVKDVGDLYAAALQLRKKYEQAESNKSLKRTGKVVIEKSKEQLDDLLRSLIGLITLLDEFDTQK
jgi:hypothetical protein